MKHTGKINSDFTGETTGSKCPETAPRERSELSGCQNQEKKEKENHMLGITRKRKEIKRETTVQPLPTSFYCPHLEYKKESAPKWKCPEKGNWEVWQHGPASARGGPGQAELSDLARRRGSGVAAWGWCCFPPLPGLRMGITGHAGATSGSGCLWPGASLPRALFSPSFSTCF